MAASRPTHRALTTAVLAVALAILGVLLASPPATAASVAIQADTYVQEDRPTTSFGSAKTVQVRYPNKVTYVRFAAPPDTSSAMLRLRAPDSNDFGFDVYAVDSDTWSESITWNTRPAVGALLGSTGPTNTGLTYSVDVSAAAASGPVSLAILTRDDSTHALNSRESSNPSLSLISPAPAPGTFTIGTAGTTFTATSTNGTVHSGTLKYVVEQAVLDLNGASGGTVVFPSGTWDLGSSQWEFYSIHDITFAGAGRDATVIRNTMSATMDTEPFDVTVADRVTIRDLTVYAGGPARSTSDAIDMDAGNDVVIERVAVTGSRGRGIVFDGKGAGWTADRNVVRDCLVTGVPGDGIELLASSGNLITGCTVRDVGGHGIQLAKASAGADQPHKTSDRNELRSNRIDQAGHDGINFNGGNVNVVIGNTVTNSSDDVTGRSGIRVGTSDGIACDDNRIEQNVATDDQATKTQAYGVVVSDAACHRTVIRDNDLRGNRLGDLQDRGTDTVIQTTDTTPPTVPTGLTATATSSTSASLAWTASTDAVGVASYGVLRDGVEVGTVAGTATAFDDSGLLAGTTYTYAVVARDAAGNSSPPSEPASVTTPTDETPPATTTWTAGADAYVSSASPTSSYGSATSLRVDMSPDVRSYLRFEVGALAGPVTQARLRLWANSSHSLGLDVHAGTGGWVESSLTYENAPAFDPTPAASSGALTSGTWVEVDVTPLVAGSGAVEIVLTGTSSTAASLSSREGAQPPQLVVTTS